MWSARGRFGLLVVGAAVLVAAATIAFDYFLGYRWQIGHAKEMVAHAVLQEAPRGQVTREVGELERIARRLLALPNMDVAAAVVGSDGRMLVDLGLPEAGLAAFLEQRRKEAHAEVTEAGPLLLMSALSGPDAEIVIGIDKASLTAPVQTRITHLSMFVAVAVALYLLIVFASFRWLVQTPLLRFLDGWLNSSVRGLLTGTVPHKFDASGLDFFPLLVSESLKGSLSLLQVSVRHKAHLDQFITISIAETDKTRLAENFGHILGRELPVTGLTVFEINHSLNRLSPVYDTTGSRFSDHFLGHPQSCYAFRAGTSLLQREGERLACTCSGLRRSGEAVICKPLVAGGKEIGLCRVLLAGQEMQRQLAAPTADQEALPLVDALLAPYIGLISLGLSNLLLLDSYRNQAVTDSLTRLYNRRYIMEYLLNMTRLARRGNKQLAVCVVDIDHFKRFNDEYGHATGDEVLRHVAAAMRNAVREADIVARYGGEEFIVVLPDTDPHTGFDVAERLRLAVAGLDWEERGLNNIPKVTVSVGIASFPLHGHSHYHLINAADKALYAAKREGRNRVVLHRAVPATSATEADQPSALLDG